MKVHKLTHSTMEWVFAMTICKTNDYWAKTKNSPEVSNRWKNVTCKNCLRRKKK